MAIKEIDKAIYTAEIRDVKTLLKMCLVMQKYMITLIDNNNETVGQFSSDHSAIAYNREQINTLQTDLSTETQQRKNSDNSLDKRVDEISNQFNYTGEWTSSNDYHKGDVINVIYEGNNTLAIAKVDHTSGDTFDNDIGLWDILLSDTGGAEIDERLNELQTALEEESTTRANADTTLETSIDTESKIRAKTDTDLRVDVNKNKEDIASEVTNRTNADSDLQGQITTNKNNISSEVTNRTNADSDLQGQITTNKNNISSEVTNRTNADTNLQRQITANNLNINDLTTKVNNKVLYEHSVSMQISGEYANCNISFNYKDNIEDTTFDKFVEVVNNGNVYLSNNSGASNVTIGIDNLVVSDNDFIITLVILLSDFTITNEVITVTSDEYSLITNQLI